MSKHLSLRLDDATLARIQAVVDEYGMEMSAAVRWAIKKGLSQIESDRDAPRPAPRRRVLSRGVG